MADAAAKKMFFEYCGNHCQMANDGCYEQYKSFHVSRETEAVWLQELISMQERDLNNSNNFKLDFVKMCLLVRKTKDLKKLQQLFLLLDSGPMANEPLSSQLYMIESFGDTLRAIGQIQLNIQYKDLLCNLLRHLKSLAENSDVHLKERIDGVIEDIGKL